MPAPTINPRKVNPNYDFNWNQFRYGLSNVPFIGDLVRIYDANQSTNDYMRNRGISWDSVKYPSLLHGGGYSSLMTLPSDMMSSMERLYEDKEKKVKRAWSDYYRDEYYRTGIDANIERSRWYRSRY